MVQMALDICATKFASGVKMFDTRNPKDNLESLHGMQQTEMTAADDHPEEGPQSIQSYTSLSSCKFCL